MITPAEIRGYEGELLLLQRWTGSESDQRPLWDDEDPWIPEDRDLTESMLNDEPSDREAEQLLNARLALEHRDYGTAQSDTVAEARFTAWNLRLKFHDAALPGYTRIQIQHELRAIEKELDMYDPATPKQINHLQQLIDAMRYPNPIPDAITRRDAAKAIATLRAARLASPEQLDFLKRLYVMYDLDPRQVPDPMNFYDCRERIEQLKSILDFNDDIRYDIPPEKLPPLNPKWDVRSLQKTRERRASSALA